MKTNFLKLLVLSILILCSCTPKNSETDFPGRKEVMERVKPEDFNAVIDGRETHLFTLENENGMILRLTNLGARIVQVITPDKNNRYDDVVLGYNSIEGYDNDGMFHGCVVGRYANRIAKGKFSLNGKEYSLTLNNGANTLHGGPGGIHSRVWDAKETENGVLFSIISPDMEEGYPGELSVSVEYSLTNKNEVKLVYTATTPDSTFLNLTNHAYWNLNGEANSSILDHEIKIAADYITPVDSSLIPTGELLDVNSTPFDLKEYTKIGAGINGNHPQLIAGGGYDHNFVLADETRPEPVFAAGLYSEESGRLMEIYTTEPGIQFYSGNFMDGTVVGKNGKLYKKRYAAALETQHFPDSPNQPDFPSTLLVAGEKYSQTTIFKFSVK